ncbi:pseudouridine synthase [Methylophilaceae bacterium]|jgi:23S rRNA pseudouridine2457 synthase|nr:pseudouridine synthase [Methylophilaceae bacterium]
MIVLFNKPFGVICQFSKHEIHQSLRDYINIPNIYPAGRLDTDSEGLLVLTDNGKIQYEISSPNSHKYKGYWVQVEGDIDNEAIQKLQNGISLKDYVTMPAKAEKIQEPEIWQRSTPIRFRKDIPTSWVKIQIMEGKNRQVRKMTAAVGFPTLRLIRYQVDEYYLNKLLPGDYQIIK